MKLIISESQAISLGEIDWVKNKIGKMALNNPGMAKYVGISTDPMDSLSPEMKEKFKDVDIEKDAPNLYKFLSGIKNAGDKETFLASLTGKIDSPELPKGNVVIPRGDEMMHPLGIKSVVTSPYGKRNPKVGSKNHGGIDLRAKSGSPVYSPLDGVIVRAEDTSKKNPCGGHVRIKHGRGIETKFCHLKQWIVKRGDKVKKGDVVGYSGGDQSDPGRGRSTGAHLHYEIVVNGISQDPTKIQKGLV